MPEPLRPVRPEKQVYFEFLRALAIVLVVFNHTGTWGFMLYTVRMDSPLYPIYMFLSVACKPAVPLFWMISGALLLPKEESIGRVFKHRVLRMVLVLALFSMLHYLWQLWVGGYYDGFSLKFYIQRLYTGCFAPTYWYMYSYIGMLLMLPFLRKLVKVMPRRYFLYLFVLVVLLRGASTIWEYLIAQGRFTMDADLKNNVFSTNLMYFVSGYYFGVVIKDEELRLKKALIWLGIGLATVVFTCLMTQYKINVTGLAGEEYSQSFYYKLIFLPTIAIFYTTRYLFLKHPPKRWLCKTFTVMGSTAFGIMLMEAPLRQHLVPICIALQPVIGAMPACFVYVAAVCVCGGVITLLLKLIPGMKKLI